VQPVETFGKRKSRQHVADLSVALAQAEIDQRSTQIAFEIENGYLSAVYERERIAVLDRVLQSLRDSQKGALLRLHAGSGARIEYVQKLHFMYYHCSLT
jgi:outer membrane protein TolC